MEIHFAWGQHKAVAGLNEGRDLSFPLRPGTHNPTAWYCGPVIMEPVISDAFTGSVSMGGSVNFRNITFNPHGHGTHTESYGHISTDIYPVNNALHNFFFPAILLHITPRETEQGKIICWEDIRNAWAPFPDGAEALILACQSEEKNLANKNYSNTDPPYLEALAAEKIREKGIRHLLLDLPSVDREVDGGALLAHRKFWNFPEHPEPQATITELIQIPHGTPDGPYLLLLMLPNIENDAAPSRPVIYPVTLQPPCI